MKKLKWRGQYGEENGEFGWHKKEIGAIIKKYLAKKGCNKGEFFLFVVVA